MKTLAEYMSAPYSMEIIPDEGGFIATIPDLPGCMASGATVDEALKGLEEAKELWIEGKLEDHEAVPEPTAIEDYSGKFVLRIPKSLHRSLDHEARRQGISLNQYLVHLLSERNALGSIEQCVLSAVRTSYESCLLSNLGRGAVHKNWVWLETEFATPPSPHVIWGSVTPMHKRAESVWDSDFVEMIKHAPGVPEKMTTPHRQTNYVEKAKQH